MTIKALFAMGNAVNLDNLGKWLTIIANFGVVAGIIFLAIEVRQNQVSIEDSNRINRLNARTIEVQQYNDFRTVLAQDRELSDIWAKGLNGQALEPSESERFSHLCKNWLWMGITSHERSIELGRDETAKGGVILRAQELHNRAGFRRCWDDNRDIIRGYGFTEYVDAVEAAMSGM